MFLIPVVFYLFVIEIKAQEPIDWSRYSSEDFNYVIDFPSVPVEVLETLETDIGNLQMNITELDCSESEGYSNLMYMVNCTIYPDSLIHSDFTDLVENFFSLTISGAVNNVSGELIDESISDYSGYPGRKVTISVDEGNAVFLSRLYLIKNNFFMLIILTNEGNSTNPNIDRFFDSFKYTSL